VVAAAADYALVRTPLVAIPAFIGVGPGLAGGANLVIGCDNSVGRRARSAAA